MASAVLARCLAWSTTVALRSAALPLARPYSSAPATESTNRPAAASQPYSLLRIGTGLVLVVGHQQRAGDDRQRIGHVRGRGRVDHESQDGRGLEHQTGV